MEIVYGERVGRQGKLAIGCSASVLDSTTQRVLLVRRSDNGRWAVPGGYMEPGESVTEACEREVWEEACVHVRVTQLVAVYSDPNVLLKYPDGNRWQLVILHFLAEAATGSAAAGDEMTDAAYFSREDILDMNISNFDRLRLADGFAGHEHAIVRGSIKFG